LVIAEGGVDQVDRALAVSGVRAVPLRDAVPVAVFLKKSRSHRRRWSVWLAVQLTEPRPGGLAGTVPQLRPLMPVSASVTAGLARATSPVLVSTMV